MAGVSRQSEEDMRKALWVLTSAVVVMSSALAAAQSTPPGSTTASQPTNDYSDAKTWLCRPGRHDACDVDLATTIVNADGTFKRESWTADPNAPIDCFYVYPTVSTDPTPTSDMNADLAELNVVRMQFARFGSKCRLYAPMYRQITLAGLQRALGGGAPPALDRGVGFDDVMDAWKYYLEHDNRGRGFVLIGHSQGSFVLTELIRKEIDGKPIQSRLVSALLLGATVAVPRGKDVGGSFQHIPLCHSATQTGCLVTYASFRSTVPPPANTLFGKVPGDTMVGACTNPAALGGGSGALHSYLSSTGQTVTRPTGEAKAWVTPARPIDTPWVSVPGLLTARCATNENATFLEVTTNGNPAGPRIDDVGGDIAFNGQVQANWGLHLIDVELAMGNLVDTVGQQAKAYGGKAKSR